jgi:hypothetical protein
MKCTKTTSVKRILWLKEVKRTLKVQLFGEVVVVVISPEELELLRRRCLAVGVPEDGRPDGRDTLRPQRAQRVAQRGTG